MSRMIRRVPRGELLFDSGYFGKKAYNSAVRLFATISITSFLLFPLFPTVIFAYGSVGSLIGIMIVCSMIFTDIRPSIKLYENGFLMCSYSSQPLLIRSSKRIKNSIAAFANEESLLWGGQHFLTFWTYDSIVRIHPQVFISNHDVGIRIISHTTAGQYHANDVNLKTPEDEREALRILKSTVGERWKEVYSSEVVGAGRYSPFGEKVKKRYEQHIREIHID